MRITPNFNMGVAKLSCNKIVKACIPKRPEITFCFGSSYWIFKIFLDQN